jgi:N-acetylglutamate synthase/N-acetylornithine aminotransferase
VASLSTSTSTGLSSATSSISSLSTGLSSTDSSVAVDVSTGLVGDELDLVAVHLDLHGHQLAVDRPELDR